MNSQLKEYYVYIMTNKTNRVLYTGHANDLMKRIWEHKNKINSESFTFKYNIDKLVYYESFDNIYDAIDREKQIKGWTRIKKLELIKTTNLKFKDLYDEL